MHRTRHQLLAVVALILVVLSVLGLASPSAAGHRNERIAYARLLPDGGAAIFTAKPDGSDERLVPLQDPAEDFGIPVWSPDRSHLLIANSLRFDANGDLLPFRPLIVRPDGSDYRVLEIPDAPFDAYCNAWSRNGARIFCAFGGDEPGIFSVRTSDGGGVRRVTTGAAGVLDVSPDGKRLVIMRMRLARSGEEEFALYVVDTDGRHLRRLVPYGITLGHEIQGAHFSPDGRWIISADVDGRLFTVRSTGGPIRRISLRVEGFAFAPNWSIDGQRIIFGLFGAEQEDLYTADPDGSHVRRVTNTRDFENGPDWR